MTSNLSTNLVFLIAQQGSVSEVCRQLSINRQQFNKYLNSSTRPSRRNLHRIAEHFALAPDDFDLPPEEFRALAGIARHANGGTGTGNIALVFTDLFADQSANLKSYLGYYLSYYKSPSWPGDINCTFTRWYEMDGQVRTKGIERFRYRDGSAFVVGKYEGQVTLMGNRLYHVEWERMTGDRLVYSVLFPKGPSRLKYLRGLSMGLATRPYAPYATLIVWKYLGQSVDLREGMAQTGLYRNDSSKLDPFVRQALESEPTVAMP